MLKDFIVNIYVTDIHIVLIATFLIYLLWVLLCTAFGRKIIVLAIVLSVLSVLAIIYVTLFSRSFSVVPDIYNLVPFHSFVAAKAQKEVYRSMLMNVLLFLPLGMTLPFAFKFVFKKRLGIVVLSGFLLSVIIEAVQGAFSLGRVEVDDVLCNTLGVVLGCCTWYFVQWLTKIKADLRKKKSDE